MNEMIISEQNIQNKIYAIRGVQVMLDRDLAELYQVETKVFNQAVKRNEKRFPDSFRFQLTKEEMESLRSQFVTFKVQLKTSHDKFVIVDDTVVLGEIQKNLAGVGYEG